MVEQEDDVQIGFDSRVSVGHTYDDLAADKVFVNNGIIFGVAGAVLDAQIIQYAALPDPEGGGWDTDRWVTTELIPAIKQAIGGRDALEFRAGKVSTDSHALFVVRNRVYELFYDTAWIRRVDGLYGVGSGAAYALGALAVGGELEDALEAAAAFDKATGNRLRVTSANTLLGVGR